MELEGWGRGGWSRGVRVGVGGLELGGGVGGVGSGGWSWGGGVGGFSSSVGVGIGGLGSGDCSWFESTLKV